MARLGGLEELVLAWRMCRCEEPAQVTGLAVRWHGTRG